MCAAAVQQYTPVIHEAQDCVKAWLKDVKSVMHVEDSDLKTVKAQRALHSALREGDDVTARPPPTMEDFEADYPDPFGVNEGSDAETPLGFQHGSAEEAAASPQDATADGAPSEAGHEPSLHSDSPAYGLPYDDLMPAPLIVDDEDVVEDDNEAEVSRQIEAEARRRINQFDAPAPADTTDSNAKQWQANAAREAADGAPELGKTYIEMLDGTKIPVYLTEACSRGINSIRTWLVHQMCIHPASGQCVFDYPQHMVKPTAYSGCQTDMVNLAHSDGWDVISLMNAVLDGEMPTILARPHAFDPDVRTMLRQTGMCLVEGCRKEVCTKIMEKKLMLCPDHLHADLRIKDIGTIVRRCTGCHHLRDACDFPRNKRAQVTEMHPGTCEVCTMRQQVGASCIDEDDSDIEEAQAHTQGHKETVAGDESDDATPDSIKSSLLALASFVKSQYTHRPVGREERQAASWPQAQPYVNAKRFASQCLSGSENVPGRSLMNPLLVTATFSRGRKGHANECVWVKCSNPRRSNKGASLCRTCWLVRPRCCLTC